VAGFAVRSVVATTPVSSSNFMALLIANGVLTVAGFLFLAEAVLALLFQYMCALRGVSGEGHVWVALARHAVVAFISVIGIVGAVLQLTAVNSFNMKQYDAAKKLRLASGGMFCAVALHAMVSPVVMGFIRWRPGNPNLENKVLPSALFSLAGACLLVESIYRVYSASKISGWIASEQAVDTMLVLPEFIALAILLVFDFDNFEHVVVCNPFVRIENDNDNADSRQEEDKDQATVREGERERKEEV